MTRQELSYEISIFISELYVCEYNKLNWDENGFPKPANLGAGKIAPNKYKHWKMSLKVRLNQLRTAASSRPPVMT